MKILVMSDSHGRSDLVKKCIEQHPDAKYVIHLGDLASDFRKMDQFFPDRVLTGVRGNCDFNSDIPAVKLINVEGTLILASHGHTLAVGYSLTHLVNEARRNNAKIALFGHTHVPLERYEDGVYILNPGSLAFPRGNSRPSYGLIEITPRGILTNTADFNPYR